MDSGIYVWGTILPAPILPIDLVEGSRIWDVMAIVISGDEQVKTKVTLR